MQMIQGTTDNIPFLGQMIKVILRNGNSYDVNISEKYYEVNNIFTLMFRQHNNIMNEATTMNLPFIGQIVKINTRNGDQYDAKFTQAYNSIDTDDANDANDANVTTSFYIMLKKNNAQPIMNPRQINSNTNTYTYPVPNRQAPILIQAPILRQAPIPASINTNPNTYAYPAPPRQPPSRQAPIHNTQIIDCTKPGTSINIDNLINKPLPYRIN